MKHRRAPLYIYFCYIINLFSFFLFLYHEFDAFFSEKSKVPSSYGYGVRHVQALLIFFCMTVLYMARAHLGVSVVAMTKHVDKNIKNNDNTTVLNATDASFNMTEVRSYNETIEKTIEMNVTYQNNDAVDDDIWNVYKVSVVSSTDGRGYNHNLKVSKNCFAEVYIMYHNQLPRHLRA